MFFGLNQRLQARLRVLDEATVWNQLKTQLENLNWFEKEKDKIWTDASLEEQGEWHMHPEKIRENTGIEWSCCEQGG